MNKIFPLLLILILSACTKDMTKDEDVVIPCLPLSLTKNVLAFYPFSKGTLNDISGNNHHLINLTKAHPTSDRNDNDSCAFEFTNIQSSNEFLTTYSTSFLNALSEFSISLWYQPKDTSRIGTKFESLINRGIGHNCPNREGQWSIALYDCRKAVFGRTNDVWDKNIEILECKKEIYARTGVWHHLVATYTQNGVKMKLYRNGVLQDESLGFGNCGSGIPSYEDVGDLFLGKDYSGKIDDVIIFNKTLTQAEVNVLYNLDTCCEK